MNQQFNKGLLLTSLVFWWGFIEYLFKYLEFIGFVEIVIHRCLWTAVSLIITTIFFKMENIFFYNFQQEIFNGLFISGLLIFMNWAVWIYAVAPDRIIDASFGYFIMPILSVFLGFIFFNEKLNQNEYFQLHL